MLQPLSRTNNKNKKKVFLLLGFLFFIYIIFWSPISKGVSSKLHSAGSFLWDTNSTVSNTGSVFFGFFTSKSELVKDNIKLKDQITQISLRLTDRNLLFEENSELKKMLSRSNDLNGKLGVVLSRPNKTPYDTLIIDIGKDRDIKVRDKAIVESIVLGEITEVFEKISKVTLYSTAGYKTQAIIGSENIPVEVVGAGGGNYEIKIARDLGVGLGDIIKFANIKPIMIGSVDEIDVNSSEAFKTIKFISPVNLYNINFVEIVESNYQ